MKKKISIIIPVYNEEKRIHNLLREVDSFINTEHFFQKEIIFANDGSTDLTHSILKESSLLKRDGVSVVSYEKNRGKGFAVKKALEIATGDIVGFLDADLATPLNEICHIYQYFLKNQDEFICVTGDRTPSIRNKSHLGFLRSLASYTFRKIANIPLEQKVIDTQAGFKFFDGKLAKILSHTLNEKGFAFDVELILLSQLLGSRHIEHPLTCWNNAPDSKVSLVRDSLKMIQSVLKIFKNKKQSHYYQSLLMEMKKNYFIEATYKNQEKEGKQAA